jgi:serine/threonine-protein kinase
MSDELGVEAGQVIAGKYRLVELLGRGGMGSVWRCDHLSLLSPIALKVIKPDVAKNKNSVARFMREAKAAAMLRSPHVVQVLDHGMEGDIAFIAMELLEGESLHRRLKRQKQLQPAVVATIMTHVGRAMQKAHDSGIVHRDLKPDNIFLVQNDDEVMAKVLDFGIAKSAVFALNATGESPQTQTGALLGTPYYMSPEQATGQKNVDHRADLWAIAVITYECLLGRRPYQSDSLGDLVLQICSRPQPVPSHYGRVPLGFDEWFGRAQSRDPNERYQSAKELTRALREVLVGSALTSATNLPRPSVPPPRRTVTSSPGPGTTTGSGTIESGPSAAALASGDIPIPLISQPAAEEAVSMETLDPLAATTEPRSRRGLLLGGILGAIVVAGGVGAGVYFGAGGAGESHTGASPTMESGDASAQDVDPATPLTGSTGAETAEPTGEPTSEAAPSATSVASASASVATEPAPPFPRPHPTLVRPQPPPRQPPPRQPPPRQPPPLQPPPPKPPPPPDDPLGI